MTQEKFAAKPEAATGKVAPLPPPKKPHGRARLLTSIAVGLIAVAGVTFYYLRFIAPYESTDDAFVAGNVTLVSPRVAGQVTELLINDNELVRRGQVLLQIDPSLYRASLALAQADLSAARGRLAASRAQVAVNEANVAHDEDGVAAAQAQGQRARDDLRRYRSVLREAVSATALDRIEASARTTAAELQAARSLLKAARAAVTLSRAVVEASQAAVGQAEARLRQAELNLSYTTITAPLAGRVTERTVQIGNYVQPGQTLLALVPKEVWVTANFKETQITDMRVGQPVTVSVDAYPNLDLRGRVDSLQGGTGAQFSLLPPENAVGNYVKVVQRVPVKIVFDDPPPDYLDIAPGMSVEPKVRVH